MTLRTVLPWALGLLALLPVILWLHRRRRPARSILVPSLQPWRIFGPEATPSRRRFERSWLLVAHLIAAAGLALGASGLRLAGGGGPVAIVLDASPSMAAADRWAEARRAVDRLATGRDGDVSLIVLDERPRVLVRGSSDAGEIAAALRGLEPRAPTEVSAAPDLVGALGQAASLVGAGEIIVVSDGALDFPTAAARDVKDGLGVEDVKGVEAGQVTLLRIGAAADNWGIAAVRVSRSGGPPQLFVRLAGRATSGAGRRLQVTADGRQLTDIALDLPPQGERHAVLPLVGAEDVTRLTVSLSGPDALAADNEWVMDTPMQTRAVQLVGAAPRLTQVLGVWSDLRMLSTGTGRMYGADKVALSILAGDDAQDSMPAGPILRIGGPKAAAAAQPLVWLERPPWLPRPAGQGLWVRPMAPPPAAAESPLAAAESPPAAADLPLAKAGDRTVLALRVQEGRRVVTLAVDPEAQELVVSRDWPRLLRWSIDLALGGGDSGDEASSAGVAGDDARAMEADLQRRGSGWTERLAGASPSGLPTPWRLAAGLALIALLADGRLRGRGRSRRRVLETTTVADSL